MSRLRTKKCASCPQWFFWARTERGAFVPLNEDPTLDGEFVISHESAPPTAIRFATLSDVERVAFRDRYHHHAKTCTSDAARRRRGEERR